MTEPSADRPKIFVYIIESPSAMNIYQGVSEGDLLMKAILLDGIPCVVKCVVNKDVFLQAFTVGLSEMMDNNIGLIPIIHISAHGNSEGIQLTSQDIITWGELKAFLSPINKILQGCLIVCMSCCEGYSGIRMAMFTEDQELPYFALIGNAGSPLWSDTAVAYATFYHQIAKGERVTNAVESMRVASGDGRFYIETAQDSREGFLSFCEKADALEANKKF